MNQRECWYKRQFNEGPLVYLMLKPSVAQAMSGRHEANPVRVTATALTLVEAICTSSQPSGGTSMHPEGSFCDPVDPLATPYSPCFGG